MNEASYSEMAAILDVDFEAGKLFWRPRPVSRFKNVGSYKRWNNRYAGKEAFTAISYGYRCGKINRKGYQAHRVIWLLSEGRWPEGEVDHINGNRADNRLVNLRVVSHAENGRNAKRRVDNSSGVTGVSWNKRRGKWVAWVMASKRTKQLGYFDDYETAVLVRKNAEREHDYHPNHGRSTRRVWAPPTSKGN